MNPPIAALTKGPPPISGGTLIIAQDGKTAIAADPDRDQVYIADVSEVRLLRTVALRPGDEPGRLAEDSGGRVHVALRGAGALVTINVSSGTVSDRRAVCGAPRGVAYDQDTGLVHVACATGELVSLPASGGAVTRRLNLGMDLRDVIVAGDHLLVSRMKGAQLIEINAAGEVVRTQAPPELVAVGHHAQPTVAWRTVALPGGGVAMVHTRGQSDTVSTQHGGYSDAGSCLSSIGGIVNSTISIFDGQERPATGSLGVTLPVDLAISRDGSKFAIVDAGYAGGPYEDGFGDPAMSGMLNAVTPGCVASIRTLNVGGQAIAVAFDGQGRAIVQSRELSRLFINGPNDFALIPLSQDSRRDEGHEIFHKRTVAHLACASCHPEAGDDGHVWTFANLTSPSGPRRTQSLRGGILGTEPFHWNGDMQDLAHLSDEVLTNRMLGPQLTSTQVAALGRWLDGQPQLPAPPQDTAAVARGQALFKDEQLGCVGCHSGAKLTNNRNEDVGTGGSFQVPSLIGVAYRAPFMHTGCAASLRDRFGACGGGDRHGKTSQLSAQQLDDLTAYLNTL